MQYYLPLAQRAGPNQSGRASEIVIRTAPGQGESVARLLRRELQELLPAGIPTVATLYRKLEPQLQPWRVGASLFTMFAVLALVVAAIGIYGVISYIFSQRTHELGVRMALGARGGDVVLLVLASGLRVVGAGVTLGVVGALVGARLVESLLYGISARDPLTLFIAPAVLLIVGTVASLPAAWRATHVNPAAVLREE
jgi:ABC-type antimicrobial peptide transport system permease subunit